MLSAVSNCAFLTLPAVKIWQEVNTSDTNGLTLPQFVRFSKLVFDYSRDDKVDWGDEEQLIQCAVEVAPDQISSTREGLSSTPPIYSDELLETMISSSRTLFSVIITGKRQERESFLKTVTFYKLETQSNLVSLYNPSASYNVERRFNDFVWLHRTFSE